jgi:hypothetical protein
VLQPTAVTSRTTAGTTMMQRSTECERDAWRSLVDIFNRSATFFLLLFKQIAYESCDMGNVFWPVSISVSQSRAEMESLIDRSNCGEVN